MQNVKSIDTLSQNKWLALKEQTHTDGTKFTFIHEVRCNGSIVVVLPYRVHDENGLQYLVRKEYSPAWSLSELIPSSVTGGIDNIGDSPIKTALKELKEECGYLASESNVIDLGTSYGAKCADTVYHIFAVDVTNVAEIPITSPDEGEEKSHNYWIYGDDANEISKIKDPLWSMAYVRHAMYLLKKQ